MRSFLPVMIRRPLLGLAGLFIILVVLRVSSPAPARIDFDTAVDREDAPDAVAVTLSDRLLAVHTLALCVENLAQRITLESTASFEVFDHAFRDECRSPIGSGAQWLLASEWFGPAFLDSVNGIIDSERDLIVRAVRDDRAVGRPVRASVLWRTALASMAARLREFVRLVLLAFSPSPEPAAPVVSVVLLVLGAALGLSRRRAPRFSV